MLIRQSAGYLLRYEVLEPPYPSRTVLTNAKIKEDLVNETKQLLQVGKDKIPYIGSDSRASNSHWKFNRYMSTL